MISVIVATYQRANYLRTTLESIFDQTYGDLEVIVIDDGSTDNTQAVVESFAECRYFYQENRGVSHAKNLGVQYADGEYVSFLDSDDYWHPEKLGRQIDFFADNPETELLFSHAVQFITEEISEEDKSKLYCPSTPVPAQVSSTLLTLKETFNKVGGFNQDLAVSVEVDWYLRAKSLGLKIEILPDVLLYRRVHPNNSGYLNKDKKKQHVGVIKAHLDRMRNKKIKS